MGFVDSYMVQVKEICDRLDMDRIAEMVAALRALRERGGRLFVLGVGGSAANAAHAVNDFRKTGYPLRSRFRYIWFPRLR